MVAVHNNIDELLAADLHGELSEPERQELHQHLVDCAECRLHHKEEQTVNRMLQATLEHARPAFGFERRMLGAFRNRVSSRDRYITPFVVNAMRSWVAQIAAAAAILLALVQVGRMVTGGSNPIRPAQNQLALSTLPRSEEARNEKDAAAANVRRNFDVEQAPAASGESADRRVLAKAAPASPLDQAVSPSRSATEFRDQQIASAPPAKAPMIAEEPPPRGTVPAGPEAGGRKLIRNATADLEAGNFDAAVQKITGFAADGGGYIATAASEKQENGKLRGQIVAKVLPEKLDEFLAKLPGLGDLKNQRIATQDVTKHYFDTDARLRNARIIEQRLVALLEKNAGRVSDLLQVEKELGRVREQIEQLQGELKFVDAQVQFATVTITLAEKDMEVPAAFLIKERVQLALFAPDVEKVYTAVKQLASPAVQITNAVLDRDNSGRVSARITMLIAPEASDEVSSKAKGMGRVENFQVQTERVARGGHGMSQDARTERDKVELNITINPDEQEPPRQQTSLNIRASDVNHRAQQLRELAVKTGARVRSSSFSRNPDGAEFAALSLRAALKDYGALMQSLSSLGKLENVTVHREDRSGTQIDEPSAPVDVNVQIYSQGNIVSQESGIIATLRRTIAQSVGALMWSVRMIGVALASIAPWAIAAVAVILALQRVRRMRRDRQA